MEPEQQKKKQEMHSRKQRLMKTLQSVEKKAHPVIAFYMKFNNDWSWNNAAGLAYNLLLAMFPMVIALAAGLGFILGTLDPNTYQLEINRITGAFSTLSGVEPLVAAALKHLQQSAGILGIIAVVLAIFNGSRLFLFMEGCLDIIYHVKPRGVIAQNMVAVLMLLLFVALIPIIILASAVPALVFSLLQETFLKQIFKNGFVFSLSGILGGLIACYILFQVIYIVVPNQKISYHHSWRGAVVAAVLLEAYLVLFPLYVAHFLGVFAGALGLLILLIFFYYFALILFLGAEVNAFSAEGIHTTPQDLVTMVHMATSRYPTNQTDLQEQAAASHKRKKPPAREEKRLTA
jgi:membrane protein